MGCSKRFDSLRRQSWRFLPPPAEVVVMLMVVAWTMMWTATRTPAGASEPAAASLDFNRDIRPILSENCFYCHGQDGNKREAGLRLDDRAAAIEAGAIVPGDTGASVLLERIHSTDADVVMPPPKSNRRLSDDQKNSSTGGSRKGPCTRRTGRSCRRCDRSHLSRSRQLGR